MDCSMAQQCIQPFINDKLSLRDLEDFLHHMENCEQCREEYDVYFTLLMGMKLLDEEDTILEKFHVDSVEKLGTAREYLRRKKRTTALRRMLLLAAIVSVLLWI